MKKNLMHFGGLILFYAVIIFGVLLLEIRFAYLNELQNNNNNIVTMNE